MQISEDLIYKISDTVSKTAQKLEDFVNNQNKINQKTDDKIEDVDKTLKHLCDLTSQLNCTVTALKESKKKIGNLGLSVLVATISSGISVVMNLVLD